MTRPKITKSDVEPTVTPKLRFPEFRSAEGWQRRRLSHLLSESKLRNRELRYGPEQVLSVSGEVGCVNQIEHLGRSFAGASVENYHVVGSGDLVYTKSPLKRNPYGIIKANKGEPGIVSTLYAVYRPSTEALASYLDHYFSVDHHLNAYLQPIVRKGAKNDMKVSNSAVLSGEVWTPKIAEQKRIAALLDSLDELIVAEGQKLEALKAHKKGLTRQLFPRDGETLPRLRFTEFQDAPAWEEKTLGQIVSFQSGGTPSKARPELWNGAVPWVSAKDMKQLWLVDAQDHISTAAVDTGARLVPSGTVLMLVRGMTLLKDVPICVVLREMSFNQDVKALRPCDALDGLFLALLLTGAKDRLLEMVTVAGHGTGKLDTDELKAMALLLPSADEQNRIASCLSSLEKLIAAHGDRLDALKAHKQGLMQQLFPSPVEAEG